ncbi:MAG: hypothetical protein HYX87_02150 [Chloroflexi bacterium]|nr:hypothetical protein [Chloroflexota bacterium]
MKNSIAWAPIALLLGISLFVVSCGNPSQNTTTVQSTTTVSMTASPQTGTPGTVPATQPLTTIRTTPPVQTTSPAPSPSTSFTTTTAPKTATITATTTPGDGIADVLGLAQNIPSMKYTMVTSGAGTGGIQMTVWVKRDKMKAETTFGGRAATLYIDSAAKVMYAYQPAENTAVKIPFNPTQSASSQSDLIRRSNPKLVGTETVGGIGCAVYEYSIDGTTTKAWIWKDRGVPIKIESNTPQGKGVIEFKDYDFSDIPDSEMVLPAGANIIDVPGIPTK